MKTVFETQLESILKEKMSAYVKELPKKIEGLMEASLLSLLGLEKRGYNYEIDHCNGRNSVLIDAIRELAKDEVTKMVKGNIKIDKVQTSLFQAAFMKEFNNQVSYAVRAMAEREAKSFVEKQFANLSEETLKKFLPTVDLKK